MREIVLDTETTGIDPAQGHRIVEIGCVELLNTIPTGSSFQAYINPERDMPAEAQRVHGLSAAFLADKPKFAQIVGDFLAFIGDARLVIHNAEFDMRFLNAELKRLELPALNFERVIDTLALARKKFPGGLNSLDALCSRFNIDNSRRTKHGALLDSEILAEVYGELLGGRQTSLGLSSQQQRRQAAAGQTAQRQRPQPLPPRLSAAERQAHAAFIAKLGDKSIWKLYSDE